MEDNMVYIDGRWVKKPTKGRCAYCGSDLLEFYDDGTGICLNCGRTFSWLKPLSGPVTPQASTAPRTQSQSTAPPQKSPRPTQTYREPRHAPTPPPKRAPEPLPPAPPSAPSSSEFPEGEGFLSPKATAILGFLGGLLLGIGVVVMILAQPIGSWPKYSDSELIGNLKKTGMIIWALGAMLLTMVGFSAAGTREMNYKVRIALIAASVLIAIFFLSSWIGLYILH